MADVPVGTPNARAAADAFREAHRDWLKNLIAGHAAMSIPPLRPACSPGGSVDGRSFREAFADYVIDELSRPARPFNDDLLRGFPASRSLTNRRQEMLFVLDNADEIAAL